LEKRKSEGGALPFGGERKNKKEVIRNSSAMRPSNRRRGKDGQESQKERGKTSMGDELSEEKKGGKIILFREKDYGSWSARSCRKEGIKTQPKAWLREAIKRFHDWLTTGQRITACRSKK